MPISQSQLAEAILTATHVAGRRAIAAFVADRATHHAPNPFPQTSVGAVRQVWRQRAAEFGSFDIAVVGIDCLLTALSAMRLDDVLGQEILRAGAHTVNVFHRGDGSRIVGAVLYGKPGVGLPAPPIPKAMEPAYPKDRRVRGAPGQLDLFSPPVAC